MTNSFYMHKGHSQIIKLTKCPKTLLKQFTLDLRLNTDVGTRANLVLEILWNLFIFSQIQYQTFHASCGFKFLFWCLTARELPLSACPNVRQNCKRSIWWLLVPNWRILPFALTLRKIILEGHYLCYPTPLGPSLISMSISRCVCVSVWDTNFVTDLTQESN